MDLQSILGRHGSRFRLLQRMGSGGMGIVYRARDQDRGVEVALKVLKHIDAPGLLRFKQEFRALADVSHPNLISLYELFSDGEHWFFTMRLVEGTDFLSYVRHGPAPAPPEARATINDPTTPTLVARDSHQSAGGPAADPLSAPDGFDRLRNCLAQLARAVMAVHAAGQVHRDIKPSNTLVEPDGRLVLLDFGIVAAVAKAARGPGAPIAGTPVYMGPEQAQGHTEPASDYYALGVMVYEALAGVRPFEGDFAYLLRVKDLVDPPPVRSHCPAVPQDLEDLCMQLLRRDPAERPGGLRILQRLEGGRRTGATGLEPTDASAWLVGRTDEWQTLSEALARTRDGRLQVVHVIGVPGIGKSVLVNRFLDEAETSGGAVALRGRCYERESVPYKGLDSAVDGLAQVLAALPEDELRAVMPAPVPALVRLFPVLGKAGPEPAGPPPTLAPDRLELRGQAFAELRALIGALARRTTLVVYVDDVQWGDRDSALLLNLVLRPPDPPPLLVILSWRADAEPSSPFLHTFVPAHPDAARLELARLAPAEAEALARRWIGADGASALARTIALDAGGNPFLVAELARHSQTGGPGGASLEEVVRVRLAGLPASARHIFDVVVVAGRPLPRRIAKRAAGVAGDDERLLGLLRSAKLVGPFGPPTETLEPSHDRIRETALALIPSDTLRELHLRLFDTLAEDPGSEPDALAVHLDGAGQPDRAVPYYVAAAERAANALALDRAMALYGRVWDLTHDTLPLATLLAICNLARVVGWSASVEVMEHAVARAERENQPRHCATALFHLGSVMFQKGRYPEGRDCFERGLTMVNETRDPILAARLRGQLGLVLSFHLGDLAQGLAHARRAVQLLDGASDRKELALGLSRLAATCLRAGLWQDQLRCNRRHLEIAEEIGSVLGQVIARINLGANLHPLGELDEAIDHTQAAIELAARAHATVNQGVAHNNLAQMLLDRGDLAASERELAEAHRLSALCGGLHFDVEMAITGARLAARRHDLDAAKKLAEAAVAKAGATGSPADQGWARRVLATILSLRGRHGQALRELEQAAAVLETSDVGELARTRAERVRVLSRAGWHDSARQEHAAARQALADLGAGLELARLDDLEWI